MGAGGTLTNAGTVLGGAGGGNATDFSRSGGAGGIGIDLAGTASVTNSGDDRRRPGRL